MSHKQKYKGRLPQKKRENVGILKEKKQGGSIIKILSVGAILSDNI